MDVPPLALTDTLKVLLADTAALLKGTERRQFMAQVVQSLGRGGAAQAACQTMDKVHQKLESRLVTFCYPISRTFQTL